MTVLYTQEFGDAGADRTVVALHGIRGHGRRWQAVAEGPRARARLRWICPDLRGHGRSDPLPPWTLERHVADVIDTLDDLALGRTALAGISYGGNIALRTALHAPERVSRLLLFDPAIELERTFAAEAARAAGESPVFDTVEDARRTRSRYWPKASRSVVDAEVDAHLAETTDGRFRWRYEPSAVVTAYSEMCRPVPLPPAGVPTLLAVAAAGSLVPPAYADACAAAGVEVVSVASGHGMDIEVPDAMRDLLTGFLGL